ncbi:MAG: UDP-2,3-diacylglucosamine diphosphatase, partial [Gammaproteobacteria bacterium]|nr:UDP-2,3-diacylglucosamine diphosphatase [Gammaproteobacteria bacterium]
DLYGQSALISHGDELCTDDHSYQRYRRVVNHPAGRTFFLSLPLSIRMWIARKLRSRSKAETPEKPDYITDVNAEAVAQAFRSWHVTTMIHGHTHRPAIHELSVDGTPCRRIVLGDWYEQGSVLRWDTSGPELQRLFLRN